MAAARISTLIHQAPICVGRMCLDVAIGGPDQVEVAVYSRRGSSRTVSNDQRRSVYQCRPWNPTSDPGASPVGANRHFATSEEESFRSWLSHQAPAAFSHQTGDLYCPPICGRAYETYSEEELGFQYLNRRPLHLEGFQATYNLAPTQHSPIVLVRDGSPTIELFRWGLIPAWARSLEAAAQYSLINARSETITQKRSYAQAFERRRCVVPLSGFYEWKRDGSWKRPFAVYRTDSSIMSVAGVWECWQPDAQAAPVHSFSIVTTAANAVMAEIHDRMPVVLRAVSTSVRQPVSEFTVAPPRARSGRWPGRREAVAVCS